VVSTDVLCGAFESTKICDIIACGEEFLLRR
jgi:hypothetical protein